MVVEVGGGGDLGGLVGEGWGEGSKQWRGLGVGDCRCGGGVRRDMDGRMGERVAQVERVGVEGGWRV